MHAASTITITKPRPQHIPIELRMPSGTALAALLASSLMWTQLSKAPMVQMGDSHASMKAQPVGQVVRFSRVAKMKCPSLRLLAMPTGSAMMVERIRAMFWTRRSAVDGSTAGTGNVPGRPQMSEVCS